jgi:hypothetical protein
VACATQASDRTGLRDDFKSIGKWRLERNGKHPVNKTAEESFVEFPYLPRDGFSRHREEQGRRSNVSAWLWIASLRSQ